MRLMPTMIPPFRRGWRFPAAVLAAVSFCQPGLTANRTLETVLARAGEEAGLFWKQFSSIACTETVEQAKLDPEGKLLNYRKASYDYLVFLQWTGGELRVEESRILQSETKPKKIKRPTHRPLLVTNGFSTLLVVFHPNFQSSYRFTLGRQEPAGGKALLRIDFEQVTGAPTPAALVLKQRTYPLEWKGSAWIDPDSGAVVRIKTGLKRPLTEIGLLALNAEVVYAPYRFADGDDSYWLPTRAVITAQTKRQRWRNVHRFSDYKRFSVKTEVTVANPEQ